MNIKKSLNISGKILSLNKPIVMGVINTTPDSFYEPSRVNQTDDIVSQAEKMLEEGAAILDIGGYSTRPGNQTVSIEDEILRVKKPIEEIIKHFPKAIISIDTFRSEVAEVAMHAGAKIVNDISGGNLDDKMYQIVADWKCPYIIMHMRNSPQNMMADLVYKDLVTDVNKYFSEIANNIKFYGIKDLVIDPGFGFSKDLKQNYHLLQKLSALKVLGLPILVGLSRKSMIYKKLDITSQEALNGTSVLNTIALLNGASILRVHDVKQAVESVELFTETYR